MTEILRLENISKSFSDIRTGNRQVLDGLTLNVTKGSVTGLIGESGGGKTVLSRIALGLEMPDSGRVLFKDREMAGLPRRSFEYCAAMQYIFQDPYAALAEELTVEETLWETVKLCRRHGRNTLESHAALELAGLDGGQYGGRRISTLSGGQRQRVNIARALMPQPDLLIADECTSMIDSAAAESIGKTFRRLNRELGISILCITHDARSLFSLCDQIAVLQAGTIIEQGAADKLMINPSAAYTREYMTRIRQIEGDDIIALCNKRAP